MSEATQGYVSNFRFLAKGRVAQKETGDDKKGGKFHRVRIVVEGGVFTPFGKAAERMYATCPEPGEECQVSGTVVALGENHPILKRPLYMLEVETVGPLKSRS